MDLDQEKSENPCMAESNTLAQPLNEDYVHTLSLIVRGPCQGAVEDDWVILVSAQMRVLVAVDPVDFRKGIDGLARACRERLSEDPMLGTLFLFRNPLEGQMENHGRLHARPRIEGSSLSEGAHESPGGRGRVQGPTQMNEKSRPTCSKEGLLSSKRSWLV